ncbi:enoyl-CoA hydratase/isomerase family protein [[Mycobacterium] crassicus]|uniref:Enoyl-CoA hydratase/isomerase family protein n=1 Tax=[Mycobacterium] crassicus TaxID=2872309 RepID=A0ABU5XL87_9MYCO|nr:enoyl-CoA hydratase/isomerase family protein [Mycolicibacter sp. MYC098]MEB3021866.1 enoyl-CoA hydratase/isomerase family protein [Mycolicibacter sp. MYC098]
METQQASTITVAAEGARGSITLNRPEKLNPLGTVTLTELADAARWFDARPEVKVVVVAGSGRSFSAGADLAAFAGDGPGSVTLREAADLGRRMADAVEAMNAVTVARLHGHCIGGGVVLAAACDLRVAADTTRFSIPEVDLGIPLAWGGIPRLVREIGPALTKELVMTCRPFGPAEAKAAGFLNRVVPEAALDAEVEELVQQLLTKSALTLTATKRHTNAVTEGMVATARCWSDADSLVTALLDPESREAATAYLSRHSAGRGEPK